MTIVCTGDNPTPHYANGCALLNHYDVDNDGTVSMMELMQAITDYNAGTITLQEFEFVEAAWRYGPNGINMVCPGCYDPCPFPTCSFTIN